MRRIKSLFIILALIFVLGVQKHLQAQTTATVGIAYYEDGVEKHQVDDANYNVGDTLNIGGRPSQISSNARFLFWTINGAIRRDLPESFDARLKSTYQLKAYFVSQGKKAAVFVDSNMQLLEIQYLTTEAPTLPENANNKGLSRSDGWGLIGSYETKVTTPTLPSGSRLADVYVARYLIDESKSITINVDGTDSSYLPNGEVVLTSEKANVVWKDDKGTIIGYGSPYVFSAIGNMTITSHEGESVQYYTTISSPHEIRSGYTSFVGKHNLPESVVIIEHGFKYYDTTTNDYVKAVSNIINGETNEFLMSFQSVDNKNNIQAYVVYADDNNEVKTLESDYRVHNDTGTFTSTAVPNWVKGYESNVKDSFVKAYKESGFKNTPSPLQALAFEKARVLLYQDFGTDGSLFLNEREGHALVVKDLEAVQELKRLWTIDTVDQGKGLLYDVVESNGETYYVTDRYRDTNNAGAIFKIQTDAKGNKEAVYETNRIGVGDNHYWDLNWSDFTKAYKLSAQFMKPLGLPITRMTRSTYNTRDLLNDGNYVSENTSSIKDYTRQQFENGWIIGARIKVRNTDGNLGGHQSVQYGAAPILNDMYNKVIALSDNSTLNNTGAPVSLEFNVNGVRYQNFEYGYVRLGTDGVATFTRDLVVDSKGTQMNRRIGMHSNWDMFRMDLGGLNNNEFFMGWERLRIFQNLRDVVGEKIREGQLTSTYTGAGDNIVHNGTAPNRGYWLSFNNGKTNGEPNIGLGAANLFIYQIDWYRPPYALSPKFHIALFVDNKANQDDQRIGRPISKYITDGSHDYQLFENGLAYGPNKDSITYIYGISQSMAYLNNNSIIKNKFIAAGTIFPE